MYNFKGYTQKANVALNLSIKSAQELGHTYIGTEHILLGLMEESSGVAYSSLHTLGVKKSEVINIVVSKIGVGSPTILNPTDFTPRAKRILQYAVIKATKLNHTYVGTEHLLLALLEEKESFGVAIINDLGVQSKDIIVAITGGNQTQYKNISEVMEDKQKGKKSKNKTLEQFGVDLTQKAEKGDIDPVIGRNKEIERVIQILSRRTKNNPCLIGEPGVGKTAVAEGLALKIALGEVPQPLKDKKIISLDLTSMIAGTKYRGDFEERIKKAMEEVKNDDTIILFIDEVHTIIGAGSAEGSADAANILKPALAKGDFQVIGATTITEYRKNIEKDSALERRFQPVTVGEPTIKEAKQILYGLRDRYEAHHKVKISDEAIEQAVELSSRYITDRFLPDKAIDLIDESCSKVRLKAYTQPDSLKDIEDKVKQYQQEKSAAVNAQDFERAAKLRDKESKLKEELKEEKEKWQIQSEEKIEKVRAEDVAIIVSDWSGVPVTNLTQEESKRLLEMEKILHSRVVGQNKAVTSIAKAIRRGRVGLKDPNRPVGSFVFLGPTGVGKTELCKALASVMFGDEKAMIRLDMSEYMEKSAVAKLIGSPPGYVGYEQGGQLTEKVRRRPYSVVLFDEIEKANNEVFNMLLQVLEDGRLTDSQGRVVDFKNTIIIMTSNVGARIITQKNSELGFAFSQEDNNKSTDEKIKEKVIKELKNTFRPEFINRIDDIIVFDKLSENDTERIAFKMLSNVQSRLKDMQIEIEFSKNAVKELSKAGFDSVYGARPLRRVITSKIEDELSEKILNGTIKKNQKMICDYKEDKFTFENAS